MAQASSNPFTIQIAVAPPLSASFQLLSSTSGGNQPFSLGYAFRKGEVPSGAQVAASLPSLQVVAKNFWSDGSMKFAVISGIASLAAGAAQTVTLVRGTPTAGTNLAAGDLKATGVTASIGAGSFGSVSWADADWDAPFMSWISGPQMSSWIYRKPVGSDPHLVGWLEVRLYAGGAVEVLPWIENGYLNVPAPTDKNATYSFTLGTASNATQRFSAAIDLPNHCRTPLVSGAAFSYWLGSAPSVMATHDRSYLQSTGVVPSYYASVSPAATVWSTLVQSYTPLQQGNYSNAMGQAGYQPAIGILPEWDVAYLASTDTRAYAGVIANAYSAGRYPTHFRDETTQRPLKFSGYPNLVVDGGGSSGISDTGASTTNSYTPTATGTVPATWDTPHHPSMGYMAYLLTGRFYFMEEVQFAATLNYLKNTDWQRQFSSGVFLSNAGANTTRGAGWAIRTLAQAISVTPDSDPLRAEFQASMGANVNFYHATYVAQPNNPQGFVYPYSNYATGSGTYQEAAWMQDFFTAAFGYAIDLDLGLPAATASKLSAFFAWKAQSIIGRLGTAASTDYLYCDAAVYTITIAPSETPDFTGGTGPWYANWGAIYAATLGTPNPGTAGPLRGAYFPDGTSYWGNLQPAIAYAVTQNVPGAQAAYALMTGASNWSSLLSNFNISPVWSVMPRLA